jgi:hypothetical protein
MSRLLNNTALILGQWFDDTGASEWSYLAGRMRCAARLGGPDIQFGGYIVPRGPTGTAPRGTIGLLKKAVALIGGGAKGIDYFEFGPGRTRALFAEHSSQIDTLVVYAFISEPMFPGNCFSAVAMRDPNHTMFKLIAEANHMIATADELLYQGKMPVAEVAVLYPRSSWFHDNATGITGACSTQPSDAKCKKLTPACIATIDLYCASQAPLQCSTCLSAWPSKLAAAGCPADNETLMGYCQELGPAGPSSCEDQGATTMAYMGSIYGMFRGISQVNNVQLDFIDEDSLTSQDLKPFKALIITEPDIPAEGQAALAAWVQAGGHLMTTAGAAAYDRYHRPSTVLSAVTGFVEAPHERLMVQWSALLKVAATGSGELGAIEAYGVRGNLTSFNAQGFQQLAAFTDGTPAIARNGAVGKGSATYFAFHPSLHFPNMNPYTGTPNFDQFKSFNDGTLPYLKEFMDNAGVTARITVSSAQVETPLLVSTGGAVVSLLDWRPGSQRLPSLNITVRLDFDITEVTAVRAGLKLHFTSAKQGDEFLISFATELNHCDFITLDAKQDTVATPLKSDDRSVTITDAPALAPAPMNPLTVPTMAALDDDGDAPAVVLGAGVGNWTYYDSNGMKSDDNSIAEVAAAEKRAVHSLPPCTRIVLDHNATAAEAYAAGVLSQHMATVTGGPVPIVSVAQATNHSASLSTQCYVGFRAAVEGGKVSAASLLTLAGSGEPGRGDDAFLIAKAAGPFGSVALASCPLSARGTPNSVFEFLRRACGFQFLAPGATVPPPQRPQLAINITFGMTTDPPFTLRDTTEVEGMTYAGGNDGWTQPDRIARAAVLDSFSAAVGLNGRFAHGPVAGTTVGPHFQVTMQSGNWSDSWAHTAYELLSPTGSSR